ncbi:Dehydrogenase xptC [Vanrija pseudolonga]|uniref:Dehydrogenase xptC n=1 Tax=Vanrija pseudolonga TaxID=143232 RepID=A0AAF0YCJ4_9TREE|nr:Dehydrogenase xptC [Vanrija pseudolonga]
MLPTLALAALAAAVPVLGSKDDAFNSHMHRDIIRRAGITSDVTQVSGKAFDFIIAGGGLAGLALAGRLSEYSNQTVLVIEAGSDGSDYANNIDIPGYSYINSLTRPNMPTDWQYQTVSQASAGGVQKRWPRGKLLGGSAAVNGLFWCRGDSGEYDDWAALNPGANQTWNWAEMQKYINKAEQFHAPPQAQATQFNMKYDASVHGTSGPIQAGFSQYIYPFTSNWIPAWNAMGLPAHDLADGSTRGVMITPSTLNPTNQSRVDSKIGYIDPLPPRANLFILTGQQVTGIVFNGTKDASGNVVASGVSFSAGSGQTVYSVQANKEVILSGGVVGSAQILQLSGIGPQTVLQPLGINTLVDLPVGHNLQDHASYTLYFNTQQIDNWQQFANNAGAQAQALTEWQQSSTGLWTYVNEAVGYISYADMMGSNASAATAAQALNLQDMANQVTQMHNLPTSVQAGLAEQYKLLQSRLQDNTGQLEIILTMWGSGPNNIGIQMGIQHPFSRGTIFINSKDAFTAPTIDPSYFSVGPDAQILTAGSEWVRNLAKAGPFAQQITGESGASVGLTGQALTTYATTQAGTEFHPLGTCSMLPRAQGGVVDTNLLVYGTNNVRVVDASIMPLQVSAHLMASTYGIAEKAADIIKQAHWKPPPPPQSSTAATTTEQESTAVPGQATDSAVANAERPASKGLSSTAKLGIGIGVGVGVGLLLAILAFLCCCRRKNQKKASDEKGWYAQGQTQDNGAWDTGAAYREQDSFAMGDVPGRPQRPFSTAPSISTMATHDLPGQGTISRSGSEYGNLGAGDLPPGASHGTDSPYRDYPTPGQNSGISTPQGYPQQYRD